MPLVTLVFHIVINNPSKEELSAVTPRMLGWLGGRAGYFKSLENPKFIV